MDGNRGVSDSQYLAGVEGMGYPATVPPPSAPPLRCRTVARPARKPQALLAMPTYNYVSGSLTAAQVTAITSAIATIRTNLPFLHPLSPEDRHALPKMGQKSQPFVSQVYVAAKANPTALPASFDLAAFDSDFALWQALGPIGAQLSLLSEAFDDTMLALGSDLYSESLDAYVYLKTGNAANAINDLRTSIGRRFSKRSTKEEPPAATPAAAT